MGLETSRRKIETTDVNEFQNKSAIDSVAEMNRMLDSILKDANIKENSTQKVIKDNSIAATLERMDEVASFGRKKTDMDIEEVKKQETSEGKIDLNSQAKKDEAEELAEFFDLPKSNFSIKEESTSKKIDIQQPENIQEEVQINNVPLDFTNFARSLENKYSTKDYHRMMSKEETSKFVELYSKAFNMDSRDVKASIEDTINTQLNRIKTDEEYLKQGNYQQKIGVLGKAYYEKYGKNYLAYLKPEELEEFSIMYLHAYDTRRSVVDEMADNALMNAYEEKINDNNAITRTEENHKTMGFSIIKILILTVSTFIASAIIIGIGVLLR